MHHRTTPPVQTTARPRWRLAALVGLCVLGLTVVVAPARAAELDDQRIADAVEDEILLDPVVSVNDVDVRVDEGVVTLAGEVDNLVTRRRAADVARTVRGVVAVDNDVEVEPYWGRMDWEIEQDAEAALRDNPATDAFEVDVEVDDNVAALTGTVGSWQESQLAEKVVGSVRGVAEVRNEILVLYDRDRTDAEIEDEVEQALRWDTRVDHALVDVEVEGGVVTLSGVVGSAAEKQRAELEAWVAGVTEVDAGGLVVERWARDPELRGDKYADVTDAGIERAVERSLLYDPLVASTAVEVEVDDGLVTLRGEVDSISARRSAAADARTTVGVDSVANRLKVRPDTPSDGQIERNLENALIRNPFLERYDIVVEVVDRTAYLTGTVDSYFEKGEADEIAAATYGVEEIRNNLTVEYDRRPLAYDPYVDDWYPYDARWYDYSPSATFATDAEIRDEIHDELWWSPFVDADEVQVAVDEGVATLTGVVDTLGEREAATENAYEGGAIWVDNDLVVE